MLLNILEDLANVGSDSEYHIHNLKKKKINSSGLPEPTKAVHSIPYSLLCTGILSLPILPEGRAWCTALGVAPDNAMIGVVVRGLVFWV